MYVCHFKLLVFAEFNVINESKKHHMAVRLNPG